MVIDPYSVIFGHLGFQAGTQVENEPAAYKGQKEITPIRDPFAAPAGLCPSLISPIITENTIHI